MQALEQPILTVNKDDAIMFTNERFLSFLQNSCLDETMTNTVSDYVSKRSLQDRPSDEELLASKKVLELKFFREYSDN